MQILIGFFVTGPWPTNDWLLARVGPVITIDHETWPRAYDQFDSPDRPVALGIVTLTCVDDVWRAECAHPGDGLPIVVGGVASREEVLERLREAVQKPWLGREY